MRQRGQDMKGKEDNNIKQTNSCCNKTKKKKVEAAVANKDKAAAEVALKDAVSTISKATSKGVYHKNNCARKVARLAKAVNSID